MTQIEHMYRNVFGSPEGQIVLTDLLSHLGDMRGQTGPSIEDSVKMNVAKYIKSRCGWYRSIRGHVAANFPRVAGLEQSEQPEKGREP